MFRPGEKLGYDGLGMHVCAYLGVCGSTFETMRRAAMVMHGGRVGRVRLLEPDPIETLFTDDSRDL